MKVEEMLKLIEFVRECKIQELKIKNENDYIIIKNNKEILHLSEKTKWYFAPCLTYLDSKDGTWNAEFVEKFAYYTIKRRKWNV